MPSSSAFATTHVVESQQSDQELIDRHSG